MEDTIAAVATTVGESSINVIRISGKDSINVANKSNTITFSQDVVSYRCWIYRSDLASNSETTLRSSFFIAI